MKIALFLSVMISFTVIANLLLKQGAMVPAADRLFFGMFGWRSIFGLAAFCCAGLIYAVVLRWLPLNIAQSVATLQFVAVILASAFILSENIPPVRWVGIGLIAAGVLHVSSTIGDAGSSRSQADIRAQQNE